MSRTDCSTKHPSWARTYSIQRLILDGEHAHLLTGLAEIRIAESRVPSAERRRGSSMEMMSSEEKDYLSELDAFGGYLTAIGYADCIGSYRNMPYDYTACEGYLRRVRSLLSHDLRTAVRLFALGESVESSEVECSGISAYLHALLHAGILRDRAGRLSTDNLVCRVVEGCFLFVTNEFGGEIPAYFGDDSIKLTRHLGGFPGQHGLDVCCGSGIQSILMARRGLSVVGLDIQKAALRLARINSRINRIDHMVTFVHADVREYRSEETYDVVVSNPPLLPIPSGMDYSVVGDGGESGLEITNEVVRLFCKHANSKAQAVVIGMCLGSGRSLELVDWLETIAGPNSLSCQVWLLMQKDALSMGELSSLTSHVHFGGPYNAALQQWVDMCAERGADHCYAFLLKLSRGYMPSSVAVIPLYERCASNGWYVT